MNCIHRNKMVLDRRHLRGNTNPFDVPDWHLVKMFRLDQFAAQELINSLEPFKNDYFACNEIPFHLQVLVTLNFLGHGSYQYSIGLSSFFSLSQPVASVDVFRKFVNQLQ